MKKVLYNPFDENYKSPVGCIGLFRRAELQ